MQMWDLPNLRTMESGCPDLWLVCRAAVLRHLHPAFAASLVSGKPPSLLWFWNPDLREPLSNAHCFGEQGRSGNPLETQPTKSASSYYPWFFCANPNLSLLAIEHFKRCGCQPFVPLETQPERTTRYVYCFSFDLWFSPVPILNQSSDTNYCANQSHTQSQIIHKQLHVVRQNRLEISTVKNVYKGLHFLFTSSHTFSSLWFLPSLAVTSVFSLLSCFHSPAVAVVHPLQLQKLKKKL